ncbi:TPA: hypothetical protein NU789_003145 [Acinetobacter baumannii]|uniref:hypothetical protein n=2 Tax=Acinetobacter baumannii TaxID=470 RepID=UPI0002BA5359|nr:hypothetical protein [Acinetobacter baumannii]EJB8469168.1 hypothetical protein [Acinetobacter baumannii]EKU4534854.1 hypothetical protein [Acinetobacter baumannii]EKU4538820.1 hypothetical protein [Acinetobacter baumannii]EKW5258336.1 hypothetical protein [Acinetobacter baumannii]EKX0729213.1 hypothetical protein [Acinetobacter baumannii]
MNKLLTILLLSALVAACNNPNSTTKITQVQSEQSNNQKEALKPLVAEFNEIMNSLQTEADITSTQAKLEKLLKKFPNDNDSSIQVQKLKLKVLLQLGYLNEANILATKILALDSTASIQETQCLIQRKLQKPENQINSCYEKAAKLYQAEYEKLSNDNPQKQYALWSSYAAMYQAGHTEYKQKLKAIVNAQTTEDEKHTFNTMYENVVDPAVIKEILESMPYKK